jgi:hypothetical protein
MFRHYIAILRERSETCHCQEHANTDCCTQIYIAGNDKMHLGIHIKCPISVSDLTKYGVSRRILSKAPNIKLHKNPSSGSHADTDVQDGANRRFSRLRECV